MIEISEKEAEQFLQKLSDYISVTAMFPRLNSELEILQDIETSAKKMLGKDIPTQIEKLKSKLNQ